MSDPGNSNPDSNQGTANVNPVQQHGQPMKFSRLGIWSFVLSLLCIFGLVALVVLAGFVSISNPGIEQNESDPLLMVIGFMALGLGLVGFVGFIMGIISLFMPNCKKLFGILGILFSCFFIFVIAMLVVIGLQV